MKVKHKLELIFYSMFTWVLTTSFTFADDYNTNLFDVLRLEGFKSSDRVLGQMAALPAKFMVYFICGVGIFQVCAVIAGEGLNITYLSKPEIFDRINEAKLNRGGQGHNSLGEFFLSYLPDVKGWSDFKPDNPNAPVGVNGLPSVGIYMRDRFTHNFFLILLGTIFVSGALFGVYRGLGEAGNVLGSYAANFDYAGKVRAIVEADKDYPFHFNKKSIGESNQHDVAKKIYRELKKLNPDNRTKEYYNMIGESTYIYVTKDLVAQGLNFGNMDLRFDVNYQSIAPPSSVMDGTLYVKAANDFGAPASGYIVVKVNEIATSHDDYRLAFRTNSNRWRGGSSTSAPTSFEAEGTITRVTGRMVFNYYYGNKVFTIPAKQQGNSIVPDTTRGKQQWDEMQKYNKNISSSGLLGVRLDGTIHYTVKEGDKNRERTYSNLEWSPNN